MSAVFTGWDLHANIADDVLSLLALEYSSENLP